MGIVRILGFLGLIAALAGCTVNIRSTGANAKFELSPARDVAQNATFDVCNGLSAAALPTSWLNGGTAKNAESAGAKESEPAQDVKAEEATKEVSPGLPAK